MRINESLVNRRVVLQAILGTGLASVTNSMLPGKISFGEEEGRPLEVLEQKHRTVQNSNRPKPLIVIWLGGGASHVDSFSMLPQAEYVSTGPFHPIETSIPGIFISELLPRTAMVLNETTLFRNITHNQTDHGHATALFFSGSHVQKNDMGNSLFNTPVNGNAIAQAARFTKSRYFAFNANNERNPYSGIEGRDPNSLSIKCNFDSDEAYPSPFGKGVSKEHLTERLDYLKQLQAIGRQGIDDKVVRNYLDSQRLAIETAMGKLGSAFDLNKTDPRLRDKAGRNPLGNAVLTAANLINCGARFVTINDGFYDSHWAIEEESKALFPRLDQAFTALVKMRDAEMIDEDTMIVIGTEFGRNPKMSYVSFGDGTDGRDHWPHSSFALVLGPEDTVEAGAVIGSIDNHAYITDGSPKYEAHEFWEALLNGCGYAREKLDKNGKPTGEMFPSLPLFNNKRAA